MLITLKRKDIFIGQKQGYHGSKVYVWQIYPDESYGFMIQGKYQFVSRSSAMRAALRECKKIGIEFNEQECEA